jgi:hypothetical protein
MILIMMLLLKQSNFMKKIFFATALLCSIYFTSNAQSSSNQNNGDTYETAIGVKIYPGAITIKHFIADDKALEGLAYIGSDGFRATGLYEFYGDISGVDGLKWYAGPGAHIGFWSSSWTSKYPDRNSSVAIGVDGVLGLDYKFTGAPIDLSLDWQPSFNFVGYSYFEGGWGGIGVRYTF